MRFHLDMCEKYNYIMKNYNKKWYSVMIRQSDPYLSTKNIVKKH